MHYRPPRRDDIGPWNFLYFIVYGEFKQGNTMRPLPFNARSSYAQKPPFADAWGRATRNTWTSSAPPTWRSTPPPCPCPPRRFKEAASDQELGKLGPAPWQDMACPPQPDRGAPDAAGHRTDRSQGHAGGRARNARTGRVHGRHRPRSRTSASRTPAANC